MYIKNKDLTVEKIREILSKKTDWKEMNAPELKERGIIFVITNDKTNEIIAFRDYPHAQKMLQTL